MNKEKKRKYDKCKISKFNYEKEKRRNPFFPALTPDKQFLDLMMKMFYFKLTMKMINLFLENNMKV